jgi:glutamate synthase (ferredoxin)
VKSDREPIPIEEVESLESILNRFCTGGMSLGAISRECHETIAIAMNRIGGRSNSGEGGEDVQRYSRVTDVDEEGNSASFSYLNGVQNGDIAFSKIKQVASGRFGVTPYFLMNAEQLEIKVSQGAKPGEGGQLPGKKVSPYIAGLRASKPGVPLISPPPHHDIYSIEDLAQLIFDLHQINPAAKVSVKLVGEAGIGTVASGVAKAGADVIQVSGHDGGTGASPVSSIKHAGGPWEMGLVETHQTLNANGLRERVVLRADGGFKSGYDVMMAALMGADEYGFGTVAMIATGCIMARICHTNNCPVGVATQREELRARMPGTPADVVNFFVDVGNEMRAKLAEMGYKSMDEVIGRADLLVQKAGNAESPLPKTAALDLSFLQSYQVVESTSTERREQATHSNGPMLDDEILAKAEVVKALEEEGTADVTVDIVNVDRSACGRIAGQVAKQYGNNGFAGTLNLTFNGSAGQSFGLFTVGGMNVKLYGEANDYVGKGMAGGDIAIQPPTDCPIPAEEATILGNTCLYGATGGRLLADGRAGERFAVRNSGASGVVTGAGDHCCEYMTGGCVVVLGAVGRNVGAGMTGGLGYFLDLDDTFKAKVNGEIVRSKRIDSKVGEAQLKGLIQVTHDKTGSKYCAEILAKWDEFLPKFWQVVPPSEAGSPEVVGDEAEPAVVGATA